jgi:hypothetical protein
MLEEFCGSTYKFALACSFGYFGRWVWNVSRCRRWFRTSACVIASLSRGSSGNHNIDFTRGGFFKCAFRDVSLCQVEPDRLQIGHHLSLATAPGAIAGALTTTGISRAKFDLSFGLLMLCVAVYLTLNPGKKTAGQMAQRTGRFTTYSR